MKDDDKFALLLLALIALFVGIWINFGVGTALITLATVILIVLLFVSLVTS